MVSRLIFSYHFMIPALTIKIWVHGFIKKCEILHENDLHEERFYEIIAIWNKFNTGFGLYFLVYFTSSQLMLIISAFLSISKLFGENFNQMLSPRHIGWYTSFITIGIKLNNHKNFTVIL